MPQPKNPFEPAGKKAANRSQTATPRTPAENRTRI